MKKVKLLVLGLCASLGLCGLPLEVQADPCPRLETELHRALGAKQWTRAADRAERLMRCRPKDAHLPFYRAAALALLGQSEEALRALEAARLLGYDDHPWLMLDPAFASLRSDRRFREILANMKVSRRFRLAEAYEKGPLLEGVRVLEGRPEAGLWWRLYLPERTATTPLPLLVWLHPGGSSVNHRVERLAPRFLEAGWSLLVTTAKDFTVWTDNAATKLFEHTLPEVGEHPELDAERPMLFGYSAGGQLALLLWLEQRQPMSGLVLMAAYPFDLPALVRGRQVLPSPPPGPLAGIPIFALVGGDDPGAAWWDRVADHWEDRPGTLELHRTPGLGHTWVLDAERQDALMRWLDHRARERPPMVPGPKAEPVPQKTAAAKTP